MSLKDQIAETIRCKGVVFAPDIIAESVEDLVLSFLDWFVIWRDDPDYKDFGQSEFWQQFKNERGL